MPGSLAGNRTDGIDVKQADIISCALVALFGLVLLFVIIPGWVPTKLSGEYGPAAHDMPKVAALTFTALAVLFLIYRLRDKGADYDDDAPPILKSSWLFLIFVTALSNWVGFLLAGPVTIAGFMVMMGEKRIIHVGVTAIGASMAIWLFFWQLLRFPLP